MDFKSLLQTMNTLAEAEGKVHKAGPGGYGNRHGSETQTDQYGKPIGKVSLASIGPKDDKPKSRGRPVDPDKPKTGKDDPKNQKVGDPFGRTTGDVPKGKKGTKVSKMADADKEEKKAEKKSLKDWIEASEQNVLNEEGQVTVKPMPGASQIIGADGKLMGTADAQTANLIKDASNKGTLNLGINSELDEEEEDGFDLGDAAVGGAAGYALGSGVLDGVGSALASLVGLGEKFDKPVTTNPSEKGKYKGKSKSELLKAYNHLKRTGPHPQGSKQNGNMKELAFAIRAKSDWGKVQEEQVKEGGYNPDRDSQQEWNRYAQGDRDFQNQERNAGEEPDTPRYPRTSDRMRQAQYRHNGFPRPRSESVEEGFPAWAKGRMKYGDGMKDLADAAKDGASKETMQKIRDKNNKYKKKKVSEARVMEESEYTYEKIGKTLAQENPRLASDSDEFANAVYQEMIQMGMTPRSAHHKLNYDEDFLGEVVTSYHHYLKHNTVDEGLLGSMAGAGIGSVFGGPLGAVVGGIAGDKITDEGQHTQHYMGANKPSPVRQNAEIAKAPQQHTPFSVDPINAITDRTGSFLKNLGQPKKTFEGKNMKDIQLESWEKELNSLLNLNEGITVSSSTGQQGAPDSVSVNATDADAQQLLQVLRSAGVGVFSGEKEQSNYGAPMNSQEPTGAGSEPEMSPAVVGDGDDMMALIKKMSGIQDSGEPEGTASSDYESEENAQHGSDNHNHEEGDCNDCGQSPCDCDDQEVDEGYQETEEGAGVMHFKKEQAKKSGEDHFKMGGKEFPVEEGNDGNLANNYPPYKEVTKGDVVAGRLGQDQMGGKEKVKEEDHIHEEGGSCNECGMYEARCVCEPGKEQVEEGVGNEYSPEMQERIKMATPKQLSQMAYELAGDPSRYSHEYKKLEATQSVLRGTTKYEEGIGEGYANEAGHEEIAHLKHLLSMGNDMHREKRSQATGDIKQVTFETKLLKDSTSLLQDFKKLSGIK